MSDKIVVPENIKQAALDAAGETLLGTSWQEIALVSVEAAMRCLSENPIVPTSQEVIETMKPLAIKDPTHFIIFGARWQRRIFLAPEPEVPEEIKDLLAGVHPDVTPIAIEAYRRGQKAGAK